MEPTLYLFSRGPPSWRVLLADFAGKYPEIYDWMTQLNAMPEVVVTLPSHWNELPNAA